MWFIDFSFFHVVIVRSTSISISSNRDVRTTSGLGARMKFRSMKCAFTFLFTYMLNSNIILHISYSYVAIYIILLTCKLRYVVCVVIVVIVYLKLCTDVLRQFISYLKYLIDKQYKLQNRKIMEKIRLRLSA